MPIIEVLLEVPAEIMEGLTSGRYVRDAAGIIRWAKGSEKAGEIYAHLREISDMQWQPLQTVGPNLLLPIGALMVVQIAGFVYIGYQLVQIRKAIESLRQDIKAILSQVERIREQQVLDYLKRVAHGVEHLLEEQFDEARDSFIKGRSEINFFLKNQEPRVLVEYLPQTEQLMTGLGVSFAGEYFCLQKQHTEYAKMAPVFDRYKQILSEGEERLALAPPITKMIPNRRYLDYYPQIKPLRKKLSQTVEHLSGEKLFAEAMVKIGRDRITDLTKSLTDRGDKPVMVVYP